MSMSTPVLSSADSTPSRPSTPLPHSPKVSSAAIMRRVGSTSLKIFQLPRRSVVFYDNGQIIENSSNDEREIKFFLTGHSPAHSPASSVQDLSTTNSQSHRDDYFNFSPLRTQNFLSSSNEIPSTTSHISRSGLSRSSSIRIGEILVPQSLDSDSEDGNASEDKDPEIVNWVRRVSLESIESMDPIPSDEYQGSEEVEEDAEEEAEEEEDPMLRWRFAFDGGVEGGF